MIVDKISRSAPALWAGVECTINRVGDRFHDQLVCNGHHERVSDLDLFAGLGVRALRYPVLWERFAPDNDLERIDWRWVDERLMRLRELGVRPIVGLVHHGSGPHHTALTEPSFYTGLANFARKVAERYPWVEEWTPVNEPLTTARFSGLYGHWYPHGRDEQTFARAQIYECRAVAVAMRAIRDVIPAAQLIQTEDMGKIYSTEHMRYQADFENERRWLTWDLLCGKVDRHHRMWHHLRWAGITEDDLEWFLENPSPPDILGINHYLTSERFLDERIDLYPSQSCGYNGRDQYVDVEAIRVLRSGTDGIEGLMRETWERYHRPLAITETHLGCTREEQMRWLLDVWRSANKLFDEGIDVRAVTAWALLGSYDWNSLLTRFAGHYEPGVYDMRGGSPRPTAISTLLQELGSGRRPSHPVLEMAGWWKRPSRILHITDPCHSMDLVTPSDPCHLSDLFHSTDTSHADFESTDLSTATAPLPTLPMLPTLPAFMAPETMDAPPPLLVTGAGGKLGYAFVRLCDHRNIKCVALNRDDLDITDEIAIREVLDRYRPWAVINAAGFTRIHAAQRDPERCYRENTVGPIRLASECARRDIQFLTFSSHQVFDGRQRRPYTEVAAPAPVNVYGCSKVEAEREVMRLFPEAMVVRTGALYGPWDGHNFLTQALVRLAHGKPVTVPSDVTLSPTYLPDLVHACLDLLIDAESGIWHLANEGSVTLYEFAQMAAERARLNLHRIEGVYHTDPLFVQELRAPRPLYSVLGSERGQILQPVEAALDCYFRDGGITSMLLGIKETIW